MYQTKYTFLTSSLPERKILRLKSIETGDIK